MEITRTDDSVILDLYPNDAKALANVVAYAVQRGIADDDDALHFSLKSLAAALEFGAAAVMDQNSRDMYTLHLTQHGIDAADTVPAKLLPLLNDLIVAAIHRRDVAADLERIAAALTTGAAPVEPDPDDEADREYLDGFTQDYAALPLEQQGIVAEVMQALHTANRTGAAVAAVFPLIIRPSQSNPTDQTAADMPNPTHS